MSLARAWPRLEVVRLGLVRLGGGAKRGRDAGRRAALRIGARLIAVAALGALTVPACLVVAVVALWAGVRLIGV